MKMQAKTLMKWRYVICLVKDSKKWSLKMNPKLGRRMEEHSENVKELENIIKDQSELRNTKAEMKNNTKGN